ncbi:DUF3054 domain-containing protein [Halorussus halobius]|uniref:DUF3054 domain-containing protein n=1 Tax=Halorussus halobius TaxID=1710537 RepID=UPI00109301B4|nr:DUF3054 domain-containing protein [Halorussus halobius]
MSNVDGRLGSRVAATPGAARLALGDLLVILGFLMVGELNHGVDPVASPLVVADTVAPFLAGWVVGALVFRSYAPGATRTVRSAVFRAAGAWVLAAAIGLALRATPYFHGNSPASFAMVVTSVGVASLSTWRAAVAVR